MAERRLPGELGPGLLLLLPLAAAIGLFVALPVLGTVWTSFFREVTFLPREFVGLDHYRLILRDRAFGGSLLFTALFVLASVPLELILGLGFALLLHRPFRGRGALRAALLIPWALPAVVSGRVFELIFQHPEGVANELWAGLGGTEPVHWLGAPGMAFTSLVLADAWKTAPFVAILLLAGLAAIPEELHRQAAVDGARPVQHFFRVTMPLLRPVLVVALLFRAIDAARIFDLVYVLTGGGPGGATTPLSLYAYRLFLAGDLGYGSAVSVVLFSLAFALALALVRASRLREALA